MLGYVPGLIHSWYIIAKYPDIDYVVLDEEQRIQSTYPPTTAYMAQQQPQPQPQPYIPQQQQQQQHCGTYFDHPEPFKTSGQQHHTNVLDGPLSPLSRAPMTAPPSSNSNLGSSSNNNNNYGSLMDTNTDNNDDDEQQPVEAPPSYENVMNETSKQFR
ncbi:unnamed protein product [[Candida] boidinii]|nr:unnamed protein product [[Candida] boidinii]